MKSFLKYHEELMEAKETEVYKNRYGQKVTLTGHVEQDREHRKWWKDYSDEEFTKFIEPALKILKSRERDKLKYKADWAIISKDKKKGLIISLRYNGLTDKNDSFAIVTILNSDAKDARSKEIFIGGVQDNQKITLKESKEEIPILLFV